MFSKYLKTVRGVGSGSDGDDMMFLQFAMSGTVSPMSTIGGQKVGYHFNIFAGQQSVGDHLSYMEARLDIF